MIGYSVLAVIAYFAFHLLLGVLGFALGLFFKLLVFAAIGFGVYLLLKVISPGTAQRVREKINGEAAS
jgi:hypothetical protein